MKLALEVPTELLEDVHPLSDFSWILAHKVINDPDYAKFYRRYTGFKVLDNSVNELLEPLNIDFLVEAAERVGADVVVAPDYLGDDNKTMEALDVAIRAFGREKVMPVVQGSQVATVVKCLNYILNSGFKRVAVPYDILSARSSSLSGMEARRLEVVNHILSRVSIDFQIHLLGMTTLSELQWQNQGWVKSIDTGAPVLHGLRGLRFGQDSLLPKDKPTMNQMEGITSVDPEYSKQLIYYNIAYLRRCLSS